MRIILSKHAYPDSHWENWIAEGFDFCSIAQPWEHPGVSNLAYETKVQYWELDVDSDAFLEGIVRRVWAPDIIGRADEFDEEFVELAQRFCELCKIQDTIFIEEKFGAEDIPRDWFEDSEFAGLDLDTPFDWCGNGRIDGSKVTNGHMAVIRFYKDVVVPEITRVWEEIVVQIILSGYAPRYDAVVAYANEQMWLRRCELFEDDPDLLTEDHRERFFAKQEHNYSEWLRERAYESVIVLFPAENLFSYFHDEIVFNNYVQTTVEVNRELDGQVRETDFALSRQLLDDPETVSEDDVRFLVGRTHGWWT